MGDSVVAEYEVVSDEIVSRDTPTTFKLRVNLVPVRAVVTDAGGTAIADLKKENFQVTDDHKPQVISTFSVVTPVATCPVREDGKSQPNAQGTQGKELQLPQGFVALVFDDLQLSTADAMNSQQAARRYWAPSGKATASPYSAPPAKLQDFTADRTKLTERRSNESCLTCGNP